MYDEYYLGIDHLTSSKKNQFANHLLLFGLYAGAYNVHVHVFAHFVRGCFNLYFDRMFSTRSFVEIATIEATKVNESHTRFYQLKTCLKISLKGSTFGILPI